MATRDQSDSRQALLILPVHRRYKCTSSTRQVITRFYHETAFFFLIVHNTQFDRITENEKPKDKLTSGKNGAQVNQMPTLDAEPEQKDASKNKENKEEGG